MLQKQDNGADVRFCFQCAELIEVPQYYVAWFGNSGTLHLHQLCARDLAMHLIKDSFGVPGEKSYFPTQRQRNGQ